MLAVSPLYFVLLVVTNVGVLASNGIGMFEDITRAQMDALGFGWVLVSTFYPLAFILGGVGVILCAVSLTGLPGARGWSWSAATAAALAVVLHLPIAPLRIAAMGFTEDRLGDNAAYVLWDPVGYIANYIIIASTILLCVAVFVGTAHKRAGMVIGGLTAVYLVAGLAQLPLPPFVISFLWAALGIVWLRGIRVDRPQP
ncbi:hypothetical protein JOD63_000121 [Microbacterium terrae]|uniref:DUF4386 family protein n=1 Tax=Microbacterium terrae TaxID=69369 RepID=A0A0M2GXN8_9MICO|nr:hypothetical protein [Microbacterium terrae]KJL38734.1 hypothetical protein RS81_02529 [Microbacterium terrae]MBP1076153.1 hypothetical protein [Microbacterium terrae]GLJ96973.1 hypothetical protein GCM10017594_01700 [Microbacterium terrae]